MKKERKSEVEILEEEAKKGNISALYNLGYIYLLGEGVSQDENKAVQYFRRGTTHQDTKCMQALAMCYKNGDGVEQDLKKMVYWLSNGARLNDSGCQYHLALCYEAGDGIEKNVDEAKRLMEKSALHNKEARKWLKERGYQTPNIFRRVLGGKK